MYCSYADIAIAKYDSLANKFHLRLRVWKTFRDNNFVLWEHGIASLPLLLWIKQVRSTLLCKLQVTQA